MSDNLEFWNKVSETDPRYTKEVTFGRKFTAIDPMYQIKEATEHMGICGEGWGFEIVETLFLPTDSVAIRLRLWKGKKENYVEQWGQCNLYTDNAKSKTDHDCMKKATTDGLTKCLSLLGFNSDVFFNKFSDNKYVQALNEKFQKEEDEKQKRQKAVDWTDGYLKKLIECKDDRDLINLQTEGTNGKVLKSLEGKHSDLFKTINDKKNELRAEWQNSKTETI